MATFNEPELVLLRQWTDARLLEDSMAAVRNKYKGIWEHVIEEARKNHRELDSFKMKIGSDYGGAGIGKTLWPKSNGWPSGFYIERVRLDNLASPEEESPCKYLWLFQPSIDPEEVVTKLLKTAEEFLSKEELKRAEPGHRENEASLRFPLEQSQKELLELLTRNEASGFIECMVDHFDWMAKFAGVLDEMLTPSKRGPS